MGECLCEQPSQDVACFGANLVKASFDRAIPTTVL